MLDKHLLNTEAMPTKIHFKISQLSNFADKIEGFNPNIRNRHGGEDSFVLKELTAFSFFLFKIYFVLLIMRGLKGGGAFVCICPQGQSHQTPGAGLTSTIAIENPKLGSSDRVYYVLFSTKSSLRYS